MKIGDGSTLPKNLPWLYDFTKASVETANKLTTARSIGLSGGVEGTETYFNGTSNISIPVKTVKEAYLKWGGQVIPGNYTPIDAACINALASNRFAFAKIAGITIEQSQDGGATWSAYGSDTQKTQLVSGLNANLYIGGRSTGTTVNDKLRITLNATDMNLYTLLQKLLIEINTNYATGSNVTVEKSLKGSETTWTTVGTYNLWGWPGWNSIPVESVSFGGANTQTSNTAAFRLTFGITGVNSSQTNNALTIRQIVGLGTSLWTSPSNMATYGTIYKYDASQKTTFPAEVIAPQFTGTLNGNASSATKLPYGTCSTAAATAAKMVTVSNFSLETGARIAVKFTTTNTASSPTLNVSGTGAKAIYYKGSAITASYLAANKTYEFVYNGAQWDLLGDVDTNSGATYGIATASTAGLVKPISVIDATVNSASTTSGRYYPVQMNSAGNMFVNVPWTSSSDTYTIVNGSSATDATGYSGSGYSNNVYLNLVKNGSVVKSLKMTGSGMSVYAVDGGFSFVGSAINNAATLSYGKTTTIATVNGTNITVTMPSASGGGNTYSYEHTGTEVNGLTQTFTLSNESSPTDCWVLLSGEVWTSSSRDDNKFISVIMDLGDLSRPFLTGYNNSYITASLSGNVLTCTLSAGSWTNAKIKTIY